MIINLGEKPEMTTQAHWKEYYIAQFEVQLALIPADMVCHENVGQGK